MLLREREICQLFQLPFSIDFFLFLPLFFLALLTLFIYVYFPHFVGISKSEEFRAVLLQECSQNRLLPHTCLSPSPGVTPHLCLSLGSCRASRHTRPTGPHTQHGLSNPLLLQHRPSQLMASPSNRPGKQPSSPSQPHPSLSF